MPKENVGAWESCKQSCQTGKTGLLCSLTSKSDLRSTLIVQYVHPGPSTISVSSSPIAGGTVVGRSDQQIFEPGKTFETGFAETLFVERTQPTAQVDVAVNASGYSCSDTWKANETVILPDSWHYDLGAPVQLHGKCSLIALTGDSGASTRFFTAPVTGNYRISVHTESPWCQNCYTYVVQLFVSPDLPSNQADPLDHSVNDTQKKDGNWDTKVEQNLHSGDSVWLKACPCGDEHCTPVETTLTKAVVEIRRP